MTNPTSIYQSEQTRKSLRKQRRKLNTFQQRQTGYQVKNAVVHHVQFKKSQRIGLYLHAFGEVQTQFIIEYCFAHGKKVFLPMICNMNKKLQWVQISQHQYRNHRFTKHRLGMLEPIAQRATNVSKLDLIIMPLLACDLYGTRMGMGGGFYDRTLANAPHKPYRLGLAHDFQRLQHRLNKNSWDQTLDGLITPSQTLTFKRV